MCGLSGSGHLLCLVPLLFFLLFVVILRSRAYQRSEPLEEGSWFALGSFDDSSQVIAKDPFQACHVLGQQQVLRWFPFPLALDLVFGVGCANCWLSCF